MSEIIDGWNKKYETKDESAGNGAVSNSPARPVVSSNSNLNGNSNNIGYGVTGYSGSVSTNGYLGYSGFDTTAAPQPYTLGTIYRRNEDAT